MITLFYLTTIFFLVEEIKWLVSPIEKTKETKRFHELIKLNKGRKWDDYTQEYKLELKSKISLILIQVWFFIGLFTSQWAIFLAILLFNIIIMSPLSKLTRYSLFYTIIHWINSLIGFSFGIFIIINHYHLKIDMSQWFMSLLN